jgi:hypothetical protein
MRPYVIDTRVGFGLFGCLDLGCCCIVACVLFLGPRLLVDSPVCGQAPRCVFNFYQKHNIASTQSFMPAFRGADTGLTGADTNLTGADTNLSGADTGLAGADTSLAGADTSLAGADTSLAGADTSLAGADTEFDWC